MIEKNKINECVNELLNTDNDLYSYVSPKGLKELRISISKYLKKKLNTEISDSNILITSGSQQSIYLLSRVLGKENDFIISEEPTYFGAIEVFKKIGFNVITTSINDNGIDIEELKSNINIHEPKFVYLVPSFNNPTGISWTNENRKEFLKIINKNNIIVIEDDPYSEFCYSDNKYKSLYELNGGKNIVYLGTFSKIICPSLSVGYIVSNKGTIDKLYEYKLLNDMNTSLFIQKFINLYLNKYNIFDDISSKVLVYKENINKIKRKLLEVNKDIIFSDIKGGYYMTASIPNLSNNPHIYKKSYFDGKGKDIIRINITDPNIDEIVNSIRKDNN